MWLKEAGALRVGDVWIDRDRTTFRAVEINEHAIAAIVTVTGEDIATGNRRAFEFYRVNKVTCPDDARGVTH
jgi:hypothetical protein